MMPTISIIGFSPSRPCSATTWGRGAAADCSSTPAQTRPVVYSKAACIFKNAGYRIL
jgi:hypothetical protein